MANRFRISKNSVYKIKGYDKNGNFICHLHDSGFSSKGQILCELYQTMINPSTIRRVTILDTDRDVYADYRVTNSAIFVKI